MILTLDENGEIQLTEKAMLIKTFDKLFNSTKPEMIPAVFGVIYWMFSYDSKFRREIKERKDRLRAVKNFVPRGTDVSITREVKAAMDVFEDLYSDESMDVYFVMFDNLAKLKEYARGMELRMPADVSEEDAVLINIVDYKEFAAVTAQLPIAEALLATFETRLRDEALAKVDVYGGGSVGMYEN